MKSDSYNTKNSKGNYVSIGAFIVILFLLSSNFLLSQDVFSDIFITENNVVITADNKGNSIPDFSFSGYRNSEEPIPNVLVKAFVKHIKGDASTTIQSAIDYVSQLKPNKKGYRGTVLLDKGVFKIAQRLQIKTSGVVLRGSGSKDNGTILEATGFSRKAIVTIAGLDNKVYKDTLGLINSYVPLGSTTLKVKESFTFKIGDKIVVNTPISQKWINHLEMNQFGGETGWLGWKKEDFVIRADRKIVSIDETTITLDAPLTTSLDAALSTSYITPYSWTGRIEKVGIENLQLKSEYNSHNLKDEQHSWYGISINNAENCWVRQLQFKHFSGGAVSILKGCKKITVEDCIATEPISEIAAFRRNTFYTEGQQTLFQRCYSEYGYHDFAVGGYATSGPNVFLQCYSKLPYSYSGSIGSFNTGILFDVVTIDGNALSFANKGQDSRGLGWNAANSVLWESSASRIENYSPPTATNWAFGVWGQFAGNGQWKYVNEHIKPRSLFYALLKQRDTSSKIKPQLLSLGEEPSSSPTIVQAQELTDLSAKKQITLKEWIGKASTRNPITTSYKKAKVFSKAIKEQEIKTSNKNATSIYKGRLIADNKLLTGATSSVPWWRGSLRERVVKKARPHITRFVPGHYGLGFTDNLEETVQAMVTNNWSAIDHNYGLWYERRMDDHERVRRFDADVWAPFYEQPFNRSGKGVAWDQLSKYNLTDFNVWYWNRLKSFADIAATKNKILMHEQYFQHNILEAGAHWSSSPWRSANNINDTGFDELPAYMGDKRIFLDQQFYDVSHPQRRKLHTAFIEKGLENFKDNSNVFQLTSAEYTGPLSFMQFWIDVVKNYEATHKNESKILLSATKDVQDAILKDPIRSAVVDVIDIKYWHYKQDGVVYAPEGGKHLAPRQHARKQKKGKETESQVFRAVQEYVSNYPQKAVVYNTPGANRFGWPVLMAGGSLAAIPKVKIPNFNESLVHAFSSSTNTAGGKMWRLENPGITYLFYMRDGNTIELNLTKYKGKFMVYFLNKIDGSIISKREITGKKLHNLKVHNPEKTVIYIRRK